MSIKDGILGEIFHTRATYTETARESCRRCSTDECHRGSQSMRFHAAKRVIVPRAAGLMPGRRLPRPPPPPPPDLYLFSLQ